MALTLDIVFDASGNIQFKDGNIIVSGDITGSDGHKVGFRSDHRFALFIKARLAKRGRGTAQPYVLQLLLNQSSPDASGERVFASKRKAADGKQWITLKLAKDSNNPGHPDIYLYGVAVLNPQGDIKGKDPQIIVQ